MNPLKSIKNEIWELMTEKCSLIDRLACTNSLNSLNVPVNRELLFAEIETINNEIEALKFIEQTLIQGE